MSFKAVFILVVCLAAVAWTKPALPPKQQAEFDKHVEAEFRKLDVNHDGYLVPQDYYTAISDAAIHGGYTETEFRNQVNALVKMMDQDEDGKVSLAEYKRLAHEIIGTLQNAFGAHALLSEAPCDFKDPACKHAFNQHVGKVTGHGGKKQHGR